MPRIIAGSVIAGVVISARFVATDSRLDEFHHEGGHALAFFQAMDRGDVWLIQRGEDFGFALKPHEAVRISGERQRAES